MQIDLAGVLVTLQSDSEKIRRGWQALFGSARKMRRQRPPVAQLTLDLRLANAVSPPSDAKRVYQDKLGVIDVYQQRGGDLIALHFLHGALTHLSAERHEAAWGEVTTDLFGYGRLEDVTYTTLAPLLRRHGRYLLHAAAVATGAGALLLVGPSYSGKTTTGLALVLGGWRHLASDVVVLSRAKDGILAHPTAGALTTRRRSFELLPALRQLVEEDSDTIDGQNGARLMLTSEQWSEASPVAAVCFPKVMGTARSSLERLDAPLALAQLMEQSVDRWDGRALLQHVEFLTTLSRQARHYTLKLAPDVDRLPELLRHTL